MRTPEVHQAAALRYGNHQEARILRRARQGGHGEPLPQEVQKEIKLSRRHVNCVPRFTADREVRSDKYGRGEKVVTVRPVGVPESKNGGERTRC